jgi:serine protease Do
MTSKPALLLAALLLGQGIAAESATVATAAERPGPSTATAEQLYAAARPKLLQIRTLVASAGRQSSLGSGFLVSSDGLAITNYHVVSQFALEPATYRLEYATVDGAHGEVKLLAIDLANDLAVLRLGKHDGPFFQFSSRATGDGLPKGEHLYSMGNPLDLGFTIVEGTYNGLVERSYNERLHFTGAVNPGMSGGPAVASDGRVVGVNVAKQIGGELVSFLVPARFAAALLARAREAEPLSPRQLRTEIGRQVTAWQEKLYAALNAQGFRSTSLGPYQVLESAAPWFTCWARTTAGQVPKPRATVDSGSCYSDTRLFIAGDLSTGFIQLSQSYLHSVDLNSFQFATFLSNYGGGSLPGGWQQKWYTPQRCREDFIAVADAEKRLPLRVLWCAHAYRELGGLYDVVATATTQNSDSEALVVQVSLQAVSYDNAVALTKQIFEGVQWTK